MKPLVIASFLFGDIEEFSYFAFYIEIIKFTIFIIVSIFTVILIVFLVMFLLDFFSKLFDKYLPEFVAYIREIL